MTRKKKIEQLTIRGFKSIRLLDKFPLRDINILIGANGVGKSNFISYFNMLKEMIDGRLQIWVRKQGGANRILTYGVNHTKRMSSAIYFGKNAYGFVLEHTSDGGVVFIDEAMLYKANDKKEKREDIGKGHIESLLKKRYEENFSYIIQYVYPAVASWKVFHFHDTSNTSQMKQDQGLQNNRYLYEDASNIAPYLYKLYQQENLVYQQIRDVVQLAVPFFDDFVLEPRLLSSGEQVIRLAWRQIDSEYIFDVSQLSDGSLRFICLATALLQPDPPATIIIDEPELGLHPYALNLLGALVRSAATRMQVILSTQSVPLLNEFELEDLIVVEREDGVSTFKRLSSKDFEQWLENYTIGELWEKNILGGRP
jgi:predicted ATPase